MLDCHIRDYIYIYSVLEPPDSCWGRINSRQFNSITFLAILWWALDCLFFAERATLGWWSVQEVLSDELKNCVHRPLHRPALRSHHAVQRFTATCWLLRPAIWRGFVWIRFAVCFTPTRSRLWLSNTMRAPELLGSRILMEYASGVFLHSPDAAGDGMVESKKFS